MLERVILSVLVAWAVFLVLLSILGLLGVIK
jgi:hypothetical protein